MRSLLLIPVTLALLGGCGPAAPTVVHGDVFLVEDLGQYINLTGLHVHLLRDDAQLDSALAQFCPTRATPQVRNPPEAWTRRNDLLASLVTDTATTDSLARYALEASAGRHMLWADTVVGTRRWTWLQRIRVRSGDTVRVNFTSDNADENPFRC
jgi:hypothetical protein